MEGSGSEGAEIYKQKQEKKKLANGSQEPLNNISQFPAQPRPKKSILRSLKEFVHPSQPSSQKSEIGTLPENVTPISTNAMRDELATADLQTQTENPVGERIEVLQKANPSYGTGKGIPENISPIRNSTPMDDEIAEAHELELMKNEAAAAVVKNNSIQARPIPDSAVADEIDNMLNPTLENVSQMPDSQDTPPDKPSA